MEEELNFMGTLPDWIMVFVTGITAYYLYRTLQSQKEVQKTQTELHRIETIRFRESIKPRFKYEILEETVKTDKPNHEILSVKVFNETENPALKIEAVFPDTKKYFRIYPIDFPQVHSTKNDSPLYIHIAINKEGYFSGILHFTLHYEDVSGNTYQQGVICFNDEHGKDVQTFMAELVEKSEIE